MIEHFLTGLKKLLESTKHIFGMVYGINYFNQKIVFGQVNILFSVKQKLFLI